MKTKIFGIMALIVVVSAILYVLAQNLPTTPVQSDNSTNATPKPIRQNMQISASFSSISTVTVNLYNAGEEPFRFNDISIDSASTRASKNFEITEIASGQTLN